MNREIMRRACINVGLSEPISIEPDGTVWIGTDSDRVYPNMEPILVEYDSLVEAANIQEQQKQAAKQALLERLGITAEEARMLLS